MQTTTTKLIRPGLRFMLTSIFLLLIGLVNAQTDYYSKAAATNFAATASWGTNTDGTGTAPASISNADNFYIQNGSAMTLNASASVRKLTINAGSLTVASNTLTVSFPTGNNSVLDMASTAQLNVSGSGNVIVNGNLNVGGTSQLIQSGGNITVDGNDNGVPANSVASGVYIFGVNSTNTNPLVCTGGMITLVDPHVANGSYTLGFNGTSNSDLGLGHTFRFGNGVSTQAGGTSGFYLNTWVGSYRMAFGNVICDIATGTNRFVNAIYSYGILGDLIVTSGDFRIAVSVYVAGDLTNNGILSTTSSLYLANYAGGTYTPATTAQTISGTGVFRNSLTTPTANFTTLYVNNTSASGVSFSGTNSLLSGTNTGTVSGTLYFVNGRVNTSGNTFVLGISASSAGSMTWTSGGFTSGSTFRRWLTTTTLSTSATPSFATTAHRMFPFDVAGSSRMVLMTKSANLTTGGWIEATHTHAAGLATVAFADGAYNVEKITNASWTFASGGGLAHAGTFGLGLGAEGLIVTAAAPGAAPRLVQAAGALGTHAAGSGSAAAPFGDRAGLSLANLTGSAHKVGVANADLGLYSVASANWNVGSTWSSGSVPTSSDNPIISAGNVVTVNTAAAAASVTISGTLTVSGNVLTVTGSAAGGITVNAPGTLNISGGTVNLQDGTNNNRKLTAFGVVNVSSGNLNIDGNLYFTPSGTYTQSGGNITIDGNGTTSSALQDLLRLEQAPANFNVTGGNLTFVDPPASAINTIGYNFGSGDAVIGAGHITTFGNGVSTTSGPTAGFNINPWVGSAYLHMGSIVVNGATGTNRFVGHTYTNMPFTGNVTVNSGSEARFNQLHVGGNLTNNGLLTTTGGINMTNYRYNGGYSPVTVAQSIGGSGTYQNALAAPTANTVAFRIENTSVGGITLNIPFSVRGDLNMIVGKLNTTSTNILTHIKIGAASNVFIGGTTAAYVNGPSQVTIPASFTNAQCWIPVGKTAPNWISFFNVITNAGGSVTIRAERNNSIGAPSTVDVTLIGLTSGAEWVTSIVSGAANLTSFSTQIQDALIASGNVQAGIQSPATSFSAFGSGSTFGTAGAPLFNSLALNVPAIAGSNFPDRIAIGQTGPLNVSGTGMTLAQTTVPSFAPAVSKGSTNNILARLNLPAVGSSGSVTLNQAKFTYTGTCPAAQVTAVTLWSGSFTAPATQIGSTTIVGGFIDFTGLTFPMVSGNNFLWVRYNLSAAATIGTTVDVKLETGNLLAWSSSGGGTYGGTLPLTDLDPAGSALIDYCQPVFATDCSSDDVLYNFNINTLSASPGCIGTLPNNYGKLGATTSLQLGNIYNASWTVGTGGGQSVGIWFDFNQDGDFADAGEFFGVPSGTLNVNVTIDPAALTGVTRMRVVNRYSTTIVSGDYCNASFNWGSTTDYDVTITTPSPRVLGVITATQQTGGIGTATTNNNLLRIELPSSGALGTLTLSQIKFTYTGTTAADIAANGVTLWNGNAGAPTAQIGAGLSISAGQINFTGLSVPITGITYLWLRVNSSASATITNLVDAKISAGDMTITATGGATAPGSQPTADLDPAGERFIDYCVPLYSTGCGSSDRITSFAIGTLTNNSGAACGTSPLGYTSYPPVPAAYTTDLNPGSSYTANISIGTGGAAGVAIWIDYDHNGLFDASEKNATAGTISSGGSGTISVAIPAGALTGTTRMRVRLVYNTSGATLDPCSSYTYGEVEDYTVNILAPPNCSTLLPFPATAATASSTTVCSGDNVNFNITVPMPSGAGITYQWRRNAVNFGPSQLSAAASFSITASGNYDLVISCNGTPQVTSTAITVTANSPTVTSTTPANRCGSGTVTLAAVPSAGNTIEWYDAPSASAAIGTGNSFVTPVISTNTTYYASAVTAGSTVSGGPSSPSIGAISDISAGGTWMQFNTTVESRIISFDVYPTSNGSATFRLLDNLSNVIYTYTATFTTTSTPSVIGAPITIPVNWVVPAGTGYRIDHSSGVPLLRNSTNASSYYGPNYGGIVFTQNWFGDNNYWYVAYNLQIRDGCVSPRVAVQANVSAAPAITTNPLNTVTICEGESTTLTASSTNLTYTYTWNPGATVGANRVVSPITTSTYTVSGVTSLGCTNARSVTVIVNPRPATPTSVVTVPAVAPGDPVSFCPNADGTFSAVQIGATASPITSIAFFENFSSGFGAGPWVTSYTQVDNFDIHGPLARWNVLSAPPSYIYSGTTFNSTGNFAAAFSDDQDGGSGATANLTSPLINILPGISSVSLSYDVSYRYYSLANDVAKVQYSVDGITWVNITGSTMPNSNLPATTGDFATQTLVIPPAAYAGGSFKLRFSYYSEWGYWFAIDNVQVNQTNNNPSFTWAPASGLFNDAGATLPYVANTPVSVIYGAPFNDRTYQVSTRNGLTGCVSLPANITIDVCQVVIDQICNAGTVPVVNQPPADINALPGYTNLGAPITGSLAGLCQPLKSDVWFKAVVPNSGDIHVYTFSSGSGTFDLDSTVVAIYSSSDGTCTGLLTQLGCDAFNGVDGHTYASASGLIPASNVFIRVGSRQANLFPEAGRFKLLVMSGLYWTGDAGNQIFADPINWYGANATTTGIAPSISKSIIIPQSNTGNYPYVGVNTDIHGINFLNNSLVTFANINRIEIDPGARLRINSSLTRGGFIISTNSGGGTGYSPRIAGSGRLEFMGNNALPANNQHFINVYGSASAQIVAYGLVGVKSNATLTTNSKLSFANNSVLLSGGVQTSIPALNYGGTVNGNIRYTRSGSSYANYDYWSSPVTNGNTGVLASIYGNNLYDYDNTRPGAAADVQAGWNTSPITAPIPMVMGNGYIQTAAGNGSVTFNGLPTQVDFDMPATITGANNWNLIGNPYPSSLSTSLFRARNTGGGTVGVGSFYFWNQNSNPFTVGNYVVVNSSNLVSGGTAPGDFSGAEIGAAQSIMVDVSNAGDVKFRNNDRVPNFPSNNTQWFSSENSIAVARMQISGGNGINHNTVIAFSETSSDEFISGEDSPRLPSTTGIEVYSMNGARELNIQMFSPLVATRIVDLGTITSTAGQYTLGLTEFVDFDPSVRVFLEDRANNVFQNLNVNSTYTYNSTDAVEGVRFRLHFMAPIAFMSSATCLGSSNGKLIVSNQNMSNPVDLSLKTQAGEVISTVANVTGEHVFQNLSSGDYMLGVSYGLGDNAQTLLSVNTVGLVATASFISSATQVDLIDAIIEFNAGNDESIDYTWDFGDGSPLLQGVSNPVHAYMAPGVYTVTLTIGNGGCTSTTNKQITVTASTTGINGESIVKPGMYIFPNPANEIANLVLNLGKASADVNVTIYDAAGRLISTQDIKNVRTGALISLPINELANGIYQVTVEGKDFREVGRLTVAK